MICYVDALGSSYLMPCLAKNPAQTEQRRDGHTCSLIEVLKDTYYDVPVPSEKDDIDSQNQIPPRKLVDPINYDTSNIT